MSDPFTEPHLRIRHKNKQNQVLEFDFARRIVRGYGSGQKQQFAEFTCISLEIADSER
jgi:hypothetical protein